MADRLTEDQVLDLSVAVSRWLQYGKNAKRKETWERWDQELRQACADIAWPVRKNHPSREDWEPSDPTPEQEAQADGFGQVLSMAVARQRRLDRGDDCT